MTYNDIRDLLIRTDLPEWALSSDAEWVATLRGGVFIALVLSVKYGKRFNVVDPVNGTFGVPNLPLKRAVILIDDVVRSGETVKRSLALLKSLYSGPFSVITLLHDPMRSVSPPDFCLIETSDYIGLPWEEDDSTEELSDLKGLD